MQNKRFTVTSNLFVVYIDNLLLDYIAQSIVHFYCIIQNAANWILANVFSGSEHRAIIIISPCHWTQSNVLIL